MLPETFSDLTPEEDFWSSSPVHMDIVLTPENFKQWTQDVLDFYATRPKEWYEPFDLVRPRPFQGRILVEDPLHPTGCAPVYFPLPLTGPLVEGDLA